MTEPVPLDDHQEELRHQIRSAWETNQNLLLDLLDEISDEGLAATLSQRGGRTVARQLAHLHNVRMYQLEGRAPDLAEGLSKIPGKAEPDREALRRQLTASGERVAALLDRYVTGNGKLKRFKKGVVTQLSYFIAHESHHRGNILLTLKQCGHGLDASQRAALWAWDRR